MRFTAVNKQNTQLYDNGRGCTARLSFNGLITITCLLCPFYLPFYFLPRRASSSSRSMCLFHSTNSCSIFLSIWRSRSSCVSFWPFNSLIVRLIQNTRMNSAVICGHHFMITSAPISSAPCLPTSAAASILLFSWHIPPAVECF